MCLQIMGLINVGTLKGVPIILLHTQSPNNDSQYSDTPRNQAVLEITI